MHKEDITSRKEFSNLKSPFLIIITGVVSDGFGVARIDYKGPGGHLNVPLWERANSSSEQFVKKIMGSRMYIEAVRTLLARIKQAENEAGEKAS